MSFKAITNEEERKHIKWLAEKRIKEERIEEAVKYEMAKRCVQPQIILSENELSKEKFWQTINVYASIFAIILTGLTIVLWFTNFIPLSCSMAVLAGVCWLVVIYTTQGGSI